jgi:hypothetical protein
MENQQMPEKKEPHRLDPDQLSEVAGGGDPKGTRGIPAPEDTPTKETTERKGASTEPIGGNEFGA